MRYGPTVLIGLVLLLSCEAATATRQSDCLVATIDSSHTDGTFLLLLENRRVDGCRRVVLPAGFSRGDLHSRPAIVVTVRLIDGAGGQIGSAHRWIPADYPPVRASDFVILDPGSAYGHRIDLNGGEWRIETLDEGEYGLIVDVTSNLEQFMRGHPRTQLIFHELAPNVSAAAFALRVSTRIKIGTH